MSDRTEIKGNVSRRKRVRSVGLVCLGRRSRWRVSVGVFMSEWVGQEALGGWRLLSVQSK